MSMRQRETSPASTRRVRAFHILEILHVRDKEAVLMSHVPKTFLQRPAHMTVKQAYVEVCDKGRSLLLLLLPVSGRGAQCSVRRRSDGCASACVNLFVVSDRGTSVSSVRRRRDGCASVCVNLFVVSDRGTSVSSVRRRSDGRTRLWLMAAARSRHAALSGPGFWCASKLRRRTSGARLQQ